MSALQAAVIALILLPTLAIVLWPLLRRRPPAPERADDDRRLELGEEKAAVYRALKELEFDHEAGHLSEDDYEAIRSRYEGRAAELLGALDALGPPPEPARPIHETEIAQVRPGWTRHPLALAGGALAVLLFGVLIGLGASHFAEREPSGMPMPGSLAAPPPAQGGAPLMPPAGEGGAAGATRPLAPEMLAGMLRAARQSLMDGRYQEAIAAYQAVLKRDPKNVDAMTHLGLIVAIGGHAEPALEAFDKALGIDADYAPAHLYRGQVLYEVKQDYAGAAQAWERFLALVPRGEEHDRVAAMVKDARARSAAGGAANPPRGPR